jgi:hypothetical protein
MERPLVIKLQCPLFIYMGSFFFGCEIGTSNFSATMADSSPPFISIFSPSHPPITRRIINLFSLIDGLLLGRCPSQITRLVATVVINTVDRVSIWTFSKIGKNVFSESNKTILPRWVHLNTPTTVIRKSDVFRVVSPIFNRIVYTVEIPWFTTMMFVVSCYNRLTHEYLQCLWVFNLFTNYTTKVSI